MTVPFKQIPANIRVPLFYAEVDPSYANTAQLNQRALLIGQITSSGIATAGVPIISNGVADAKTQGGQGSQLARMMAAYRANDPFGEVWYLPLADAAASVAATGSILFAGPSTAAGTYHLYIAGVYVPVSVASGTASTAIATAVSAAINALGDLPVTASVASSTVTITAKNKGTNGNDIDIRHNYLGSAGGQSLPAGVTATITAMASGATDPTTTLATALANLVDMPFDFIVFPYTDTTSLNTIKSFLDDVSGRWSWAVQIYGHCFTAARNTFANLVTLGTARNDQHTSIMGFYDSPSLAVEWAAAVAAATAVSTRANVGLPMQTVPLVGILAPPLQSRFLLSARNTLLFDGISTFNVGADGTVRIENLITTYQTNSFGQVDNSYLEIETMMLLMYVLRQMATMVTTKYARVKLAQNGTRLAPGSGVVTPNVIRADLIALYRTMEDNGIVQNSAAFAAGLIVQINASNPNRVDVLWPGTLIGQLRIFALLAQFRLQ